MSIARKKYDAHLQWLRELAAKEKLPFSDVLRYITKTPRRLSELIETPEQTEARLIELGRTHYYEQLIDDLINVTESGIEKMVENRLKKLRSQASKYAADCKHNKPGGARSKHTEIQKIWATGKYANRDLCAEEECVALGFAFKTARNALKGTPNPWPAKQQKKK